MSKAARHQAIENLILRQEISTQDALRELLLAAGFKVTQATLSRDLVELNAIKVPGKKFASVYALAGVASSKTLVTPDTKLASNLVKVAAEVVTGVDSALNQVVVHTRPGAAHYLASAIDKNLSKQILGSIAGDDTVLVITRSENAAKHLVTKFQSLIDGKAA
jgi:transcriptional regulator of arginine metabolism